MAANIEVKAQLADPQTTINRLREMGAPEPQVLSQDDTFFAVSRGRLKMRCDEAGSCELIYYRRENKPGPRLSTYFREFLEDPTRKAAELEQRFGLRSRVRKERLLFFLDDVRIHLDSVENLGSFIEIEVPVRSDRDFPRARAAAKRLMERLGIQPQDLVPEAYEDLAAAQSEPSDHDPN